MFFFVLLLGVCRFFHQPISGLRGLSMHMFAVVWLLCGSHGVSHLTGVWILNSSLAVANFRCQNRCVHKWIFPFCSPQNHPWILCLSSPIGNLIVFQFEWNVNKTGVRDGLMIMWLFHQFTVHWREPWIDGIATWMEIDAIVRGLMRRASHEHTQTMTHALGVP